MIIRKPYAFLIKRFKLIHAVLSVLLVYLTIVTFNIFDFFNTYATNSNIVMLDLVSSYLSIFVFLVCLIIIVISLGIYYLLDKKNKPNKIYLFNCVFYSLLFIFFIVNIALLQDLETNTFDFEKVRVIRDICVIFMVPQAIVFAIIAGRALGFNIREFDFKKDLNELEIDEKDYEEVEVSLGKDNYKYKRALRKSIRLFKYFLLENKFFVTMICSIFALTISLVVFLNLRIYNMHYNEKQEFVANAVYYTANESYLAYKDIYGNIINNDKYYLLINLSLKNKLNRKLVVDRDTFRLNLSNSLLIPKFTYGEQFLDVGQVFTQATLEPGESRDVVLVFELYESQIKSEYILRVKNAEYLSLANLQTDYIDIVIKPKNINQDTDAMSYNLPNKFDLSNSILGKTSIYVSNYQIESSFKEKYESCYNNKCNTYTYIVKPSGKNTAVLRIKSEVTIDETKFISKYIKYPSNFYKYFSKISYRCEGVTKTITPNIIDSKYGVEEYTYIEVPSIMKSANKIEVLINIRGVKYTLVLK